MGCGASSEESIDAPTTQLAEIQRTPVQLKKIVTLVSPTWITLLNKESTPATAVSYFGKSHPGRDPMNPVKSNQDNIVVTEISPKGSPSIHFFGVFDGHGTNGSEVSEYVKHTMNKLLSAELSTEAGVKAALEGNISDIFNKCAKATQMGLVKLGIDLATSGSTACMMILTADKMITANVGDSRAVICRHYADGKKEVVRLTRDHKPTEPDEEMRINQKGGVVRQMQLEGNPVGPPRVFIKGQELPGLCMGRSFGDLLAQSVGVVCEPEYKTFDLLDGAETAHIVMGSDGIYEFIEDDEIMQMACASTIDMGVETIIDKARQKWTHEENSVIDDCTGLLLHVKKKNPPPAAPAS